MFANVIIAPIAEKVLAITLIKLCSVIQSAFH